MSEHNARFISTDPATLAAELSAIGSQWPGQEIMRRKSHFLAIEVSGLSSPGASALKQEMLSRGGDVATHEAVITCEIERSNALVLGTLAQIGDLIPKLRQQAFGLPTIADELAALLATLSQPFGPVQLGPYKLPVGERTLLMGIVNMTPDSFSGDGLGLDYDAALRQALQMQADGADILDVGGMSTRPGSAAVSPQEELDRVLPVIRRIKAEVDLPISVDTYRAEVAEAALNEGAVIVNDITGLREAPEIAAIVARHEAALVVMHIQGSPSTMQLDPHYDDLLGEVIRYLRDAAQKALDTGVGRERIWVDPGIGFGKTKSHNLELLRRLGELRSLGHPLLLGTSRKNFIGRILGGVPPEERVTGTGATVALGIAQGANIVRVHDVKPAVEVARMADAILHPAE